MRVDGKLGGRGPALCFCGGLGVDKPRSLGGLTRVRNKSETQCYHDPRRPGLAVRMVVRPFVWAACAQHIHVNLRPGCFQISRANPKRPQLLKRGFVLESHRRHLSRSRAVSACHERPPRPSRSGAVSACSVPRARLARGRFRPVTSVPAPVSLGGGFRLSRASTAPVSLGGGFCL